MFTCTNMNMDNNDYKIKNAPAPVEFNPDMSDSDSNDSKWGLQIVLNSTPKKRRIKKEIDPEEKAMIEQFEMDLEESLEKKAAKSNLKPLAVKSILRHVFTDEHVLALVNQTENNQCIIPYEPKITRSKAKELFPSSTPLIIPSPWKQSEEASKVQVLLNEELQEESSDDEYVPGDDESEDDTSFAGTISNPATPISTEKLNQSMQDDVFKTPKSKKDKESATIALRTRSKLSLSQTPLEQIEQMFMPPDITTDMYETDCNDEDWKEFLKSFTKPLDEVVKANEDEDHDPEYNIFMDEEINKVDKEELRADKAVKVPKRELGDLMAELFEYVDIYSKRNEDLDAVQHSNQDGFDSCMDLWNNATVLSTTNLEEETSLAQQENTVNEEELNLSSIPDDLFADNQLLLLKHQLRQHVQLLAQHFILMYNHPYYNEFSYYMKEYLLNLKFLSDQKANSVFQCVNLQGALELVSYWEQLYDSDYPEAEETKRHYMDVMKKSVDLHCAGEHYFLPFPPLVLKTIAESEVFIYPSLLPQIPFKHPDLMNQGCVPFLQSEYQLIALGLEELVPYCSKLKDFITSHRKLNMKRLADLICVIMMPGRKSRQIHRQIITKNKAKEMPNPIAFYFLHKKAPLTVHLLIPLEKFKVVPPKERAPKTLPRQWRNYIWPAEDVEGVVGYEEVKLEQYTKIAPIPSQPVVDEPPKELPKLLPKVDNNPMTNKREEENKSKKNGRYMDFFKRKLGECFRKTITYSQYYFLKKYMEARKETTAKEEKLFVIRLAGNSLQVERNMPSLNLSNESIRSMEENSRICTNSGPADFQIKLHGHLNNSNQVNKVNFEKTSSNINNLINENEDITRYPHSNSFAMLAPPDSVEEMKGREKFAEKYFEKLKETLQTDDLKSARRLFLTKAQKMQGPVDFYKKLYPILTSRHEYLDLINHFLRFFHDEQANAVGKLIPFFILNHLEKFRHILESYFRDQPYVVTCIQKGLSDIVGIESEVRTLERVKKIVIPLLKTNPQLCDRLLHIFLYESPITTLLNGSWELCHPQKNSETLSNNSSSTESNPTLENEFCECDCHINPQLFNKTPCINCGIRFIDGKIYCQTGMGLKLVGPIKSVSREISKPSKENLNELPAEDVENKETPFASGDNEQQMSLVVKVPSSVKKITIRKSRKKSLRLVKNKSSNKIKVKISPKKKLKSPNCKDIQLKNKEIRRKWSREEDKILLETYQQNCDQDIAGLIAQKLGNRSIDEVNSRLQDLMKLLEQMQE